MGRSLALFLVSSVCCNHASDVAQSVSPSALVATEVVIESLSVVSEHSETKLSWSLSAGSLIPDYYRIERDGLVVHDGLRNTSRQVEVMGYGIEPLSESEYKVIPVVAGVDHAPIAKKVRVQKSTPSALQMDRIVLLAFADTEASVAEDRLTKEALQAVLTGSDAQSVKSVSAAHSFGRFSFSVAHLDGWIRLAHKRAHYCQQVRKTEGDETSDLTWHYSGCDRAAIYHDLEQQLGLGEGSFAKLPHHAVVFADDMNGGDSEISGPVRLAKNATFWLHEVYHRLGLDHTVAWRCQSGDGSDATSLRTPLDGCGSPSSGLFEYGDSASVMGSGSATTFSLLAFQASQLGWIDERAIRTLADVAVNTTELVEIEQIEIAGTGTKELRIPALKGHGDSVFYTLTFHLPQGYDSINDLRLGAAGMVSARLCFPTSNAVSESASSFGRSVSAANPALGDSSNITKLASYADAQRGVSIRYIEMKGTGASARAVVEITRTATPSVW